MLADGFRWKIAGAVCGYTDGHSRWDREGFQTEAVGSSFGVGNPRETACSQFYTVKWADQTTMSSTAVCRQNAAHPITANPARLRFDVLLGQ
jgi:hypothetical protein